MINRGRPARLMGCQVYGAAADIVEGAVVMPGVTEGTDQSSVIVGSGAAADAVGLMAELHDYSVSGDHDPGAGTIFGAATRKVIPFLPGCEVAAEINQSTVLDVATVSAANHTITSIENDIGGGWMYVVSGTGLGQFFFILTEATDVLALKSTPGTTLVAGTSKVIVTRPKFWQKHTLASAADKIVTSTSAGSLTWVLLRTEIKFDGEEGWIEADPTKHNALTGLNGKNFMIRYIMSPRDTLYNPGS